MDAHAFIEQPPAQLHGCAAVATGAIYMGDAGTTATSSGAGTEIFCNHECCVAMRAEYTRGWCAGYPQGKIYAFWRLRAFTLTKLTNVVKDIEDYDLPAELMKSRVLELHDQIMDFVPDLESSCLRSFCSAHREHTRGWFDGKKQGMICGL